ncbi:hypothetical protein PV458_22700 [Streptomyces sp. MN03-5084-2B]|nr:hypothetical protein [Streptomyces sp. MN03-5084-2B]
MRRGLSGGGRIRQDQRGVAAGCVDRRGLLLGLPVEPRHRRRGLA